jgi:hypothetical protein
MRLACYLLSWLSCYAPPSEYPKRSERRAGNVLSQTDYCRIQKVKPHEFATDEIVAYKDKYEHWIYAKITFKDPGLDIAIIEYQVPVQDSFFKRNYSACCNNLRKLPSTT